MAAVTWRILVLASNRADGRVYTSDIRLMKAGGVLTPIVLASVSHSPFVGTNNNAQIFDGNLEQTIGFAAPLPIYIQFNLTTADDITNFDWVSSNTNLDTTPGRSGPRTFELQYWDGSSWVMKYRWSNRTDWTTKSQRVNFNASNADYIPPVVIARSYTFDSKIQLGQDYYFNYVVSPRVLNNFTFEYKILTETKSDFSFSYATQLGEDFSFDNKVDVGASFSFNQAFEGVVYADFDFNYYVTLGASYSFDSSIYLSVDFSFDYRTQLSTDFGFSYQIEEERIIMPHRYWRLEVVKWTSDQRYLGLSGLNWLSGATNVNSSVVGATPSLTIQAGSLTSILSYNSSTICQWDFITGTLVVSMDYDFGSSGVDITGVEIYPNKDDADRTPRAFWISYSDDGTNFTRLAYTHLNIVGASETWSVGTKKTFTIPTVKANYQHWGMVGIGGRPISIGELEFLDVSSVDLTTGKTANASSVFDTTVFASMLIDDNLADAYTWASSTSWAGYQKGGDDRTSGAAGDNTQGPGFVSVDFGTSVQPRQMTVRSRDDATYWTQTPWEKFWIACGDDGKTFIYRDYVAQSTNPYTGQSQKVTYNITQYGASSVEADFEFDSKIQVGAAFEFDSKILSVLRASYEFSYRVGEPVVADYDFDYRVLTKVIADFSFDYHTDLFREFQFAYGFNSIVNAEFIFDYGIYKTFDFDFDASIKETTDGINREFTFTYNYAKRPTAKVIRIPAESPLSEAWQWASSVIVAQDGTEQRAALRAHPRTQDGFDYLILNEEDRRIFYADLYDTIKTGAVVPQWQYAVQTVQAAAQGTQLLRYNPNYTDLRGGDAVYIVLPYGLTGVVGLVVNCQGGYATLADDLEIALPRGSWIVPCRLMSFNDGTGIAMRSIAGTVGAVFTSLDQREIMRPNGARDLVEYYDGLPIVPFRPLANNDVGELFSANVDVLDISLDGVPELMERFKMPVVAGSRQFDVQRPTSLDYWREFASIVGGQARPFLMPTYREDFAVLSLAGPFLTVAGHDHQVRAEFAAYGRVQIETPDGVFNRRIVAVTPAGTNLDLTLDSPVVGTPSRVSYLMQSRLSADSIRLEHNPAFVRVTLDVRTTNE